MFFVMCLIYWELISLFLQSLQFFKLQDKNIYSSDFLTLNTYIYINIFVVLDFKPGNEITNFFCRDRT